MNYTEIQNIFGEPLENVLRPKTLGRIKLEYLGIGAIGSAVLILLYLYNKDEIDDAIKKLFGEPSAEKAIDVKQPKLNH